MVLTNRIKVSLEHISRTGFWPLVCPTYIILAAWLCKHRIVQGGQEGGSDDGEANLAGSHRGRHTAALTGMVLSRGNMPECSLDDLFSNRVWSISALAAIGASAARVVGKACV